VTSPGPPVAPPLTPAQVRRYARHVLLDDVGGVGQRAVLAATAALTVTGDPAEVVALAYLAAAGIGALTLRATVGVITLAEAWVPPLSVADIGRPRGEALLARLPTLGPDTRAIVDPRAPDAGDGEVRLPPRPAWWPGADQRARELAPSPDDLALALWRGGAAATATLARLIAAARAGVTP
jgi:hypothetical protein